MEVAFDVMKVAARDDRVSDIKNDVASLLSFKAVLSGHAASLRGRILHLSNTMPGKLGRAVLAGINEAAQIPGVKNWNSRIEWDLRFLRIALDGPRLRSYSLTGVSERRTWAWTDASFEPGCLSIVPFVAVRPQ